MNWEAKIRIGYIYEEGRGVKKSEEQSNYWFLKAAAKFNVDSIKAIKELAIQFELAPSFIKDLNPAASSLEIRTVSYDDGSSYTGSLVNGARQGQGKVKYSNGSVYEGNWFNDQCHGQGKCFYFDGSYYEGSWSNGSEHGEGKYTWVDGSYYEGSWSNGSQHGEGKFTWADGSYYDGNWAEGSYQGYGKYVFSNGATYEGNWSEGALNGFGKYVYTDGSSYEGNWLKGDKHGLGKETLPDGTVLQGHFQFGKFHIKAIETPSNYSPTPTNNAKVDLSGFEETERSVCLHCGYEGVFGINHTHENSAFTRSFGIGWFTFLGTFITFLSWNPDDHRTLGTLILILPIIVAIAYYRNLSIKELNCVNCKNSFYQDKKGKVSKTNNKGDF